MNHLTINQEVSSEIKECTEILFSTQFDHNNFKRPVTIRVEHTEQTGAVILFQGTFVGQKEVRAHGEYNLHTKRGWIDHE